MNLQPMRRKGLIRELMENPAYLAMGARRRLKLIKEIEAGLELPAARFRIKALHWIKTGKLG